MPKNPSAYKLKQVAAALTAKGRIAAATC